ncbi:hypothetical protein [Baekduia sp. Peel2402]|uniref:hypothetical protein n=1 Tax=Baekduia sp. Peel2402 TaxID=3458296 RepID=UPI00403EC201
MSRIARFVVLATALTSLFTVVSSTAGAVTWTNTGSTTFHATGGPGTLSVGANNFTCSASTATGTAAADSTGTVYRMPGTITFSPCLLAGQATFAHCGFTLTGSAWSAGAPAVTTGSVDITCDIRLTNSPATKLCHVEGTTPFSYINPQGATAGRITLTTGSSGLVVDGDSCLLGNGGAHLSEQTIPVTSAAGSPVITRHA